MDNITLTVYCPFCHKDYTILVPKLGYHNWRKGMLIQQAMPNVDADTREALISGTCSKCWKATFQ